MWALDWGVVIAALGLIWGVAKWWLGRNKGEAQRQALWEYRPEFFAGLNNPPNRGRQGAGTCQAMCFYLMLQKQRGPVQAAWRHAPRKFQNRYESAETVLRVGWRSEIDEEKLRTDRDAAIKIQVDSQMEALRLLGEAWDAL